MSALSFSFSPEVTTKVHDAFISLAKFGETVCMEARGDILILTTLNSSKTSYASFALDAKTFFLSYNFGLGEGARFTCQLYNKALLAVFKSRVTDPRGGDTSIERCEVSVEDKPDKVQCRLVVRMVCKHGVTKTYRLTYESVEVSHALFDRYNAPNEWRISSRILREYIEYFGVKTEQLDLLVKDEKAIFTSFTEKIMDGKEILKQPLETAISLSIMDFDDLHAEEDVHIVINVKDFKAIVTHAETLKAPISAQFSRPGRPLLFRYTDRGLTCEFILMTTGISQAITPATAPKVASTRPGGRFSRQPSTVPLRPSRQSTVDAEQSTREPSMAPVVPPRQSSHAPAQSVEGRNTDMAPPPKPASVTGVRERRILGGTLGRQISQATTTSNPDRTSLFVAQDEDDELRWEPANHEEEPEQDEMLAWDANADVGAFHPTVRDAFTHEPPPLSQSLNRETQGMPPTQRLSQMNGLFD
ncbi:Rad9-domain-containing protein [Aureobasidium pullulans]|uniref:DNA repair protein rad9 n=1 Tax=Aureobasidium pullulans TaxID=5580 RepID=A0A4V4JX12_AURPU|nr:Rad9-domain-containing protein [Aureobasidium pullulans]